MKKRVHAPHLSLDVGKHTGDAGTVVAELLAQEVPHAVDGPGLEHGAGE